MVDEQWIADGVAMATRLKEQGLAEQAAKVLRWIERRAIPADARARWRRDRVREVDSAWRKVRTSRPCSVVECSSQRMWPHRPWCRRHRPHVARVAVMERGVRR